MKDQEAVRHKVPKRDAKNMAVSGGTLRAGNGNQEAVSGETPTGKQENMVSLSKELGRVLDDYERGEEIHEPLELCVDLAENLERELHLHRLGDVDRAARMAVEAEAGEVLACETGKVVEVDFIKKRERNDG